MSDRQFQESKHAALQRQGWHCMRCGRNLHDPTVWPGRSGHHRQLRRRADPTVRDLPCNIVELCGSGTTGCHGWTHAHPADAERFGYIIPSWRGPLSVPIRDWNGDWWWLLDDGTALAQTVYYPQVCGVAVVCDGGGDVRVAARITELVRALLDISSTRICVEQRRP